MKTSRIQRIPLVAIAAFTLFAATAQATHWPMAGADSGRSGYQAADQAGLPLKHRGTVPQSLQTSPIITAGADISAQNVAYGYLKSTDGNVNGHIALYKFSSPETAVGNPDIDNEQPRDGLGTGNDDPDQFGPTGDVVPMDASTHGGGPTRIYAIHNDDNQTANTDGAPPAEETLPNPQGNDLAIAEVNASTGALVRDHFIGSRALNGGTNTNGMTIESAPVMGPDAGGSREIYFTASRTSGMPSVTTKHLVKIIVDTVAAAADTEVVSGLEISPNIADLNLKARIAMVNFKDPDGGFVVPMILLPTTDGLKTIRKDDPGLNDFGPSINALGTTWSPSVPVRADGSAQNPTPFFYVAGSTAEGTVVYKLKQGEGSQGDPALASFELAEGDGQSPELPGKPGPAMSLAQVIPVAGPGTNVAQPGRVIVTTASNVYSLNTENLGAENPPTLFAGPAATGFSKTAPATSGNLGFAVTDAGAQHVFYLTPVNGEMSIPLEPDTFQPDPDSLDSTSSLGQPAVSRGRVVLPANNGAFVYGPNVSIVQPNPNVNVSGGSVPLEAAVVDLAFSTVTFKIDGSTVCTDNALDGNRATCTWDSRTVTDGPHALTAEATNGVDTERSATRLIIVNNFANPTAALTVSPNPGNVGQDVTLNASGSVPTAGEAGETLTKYEYDIDGDNDFNDGVANAAIVKVQFTTPGLKTVSVRVTDSHGDVDTDSETFRVNSPPAFDLKATPNPAAPGQPVEIDATATDSDGTITKYEFDLDGNGTFELDNGSNPKTTKAFTTTTNVSARVTDNEGGQTIKTVTVTLPPANAAPVASFIVAPNPAKVGQDVGFSAAASKDPDGTIAKYEWDFDGNGTFETSGGTNPLIAHKFPAAGVFKVALRVTDNAGATGTSAIDVIVSGTACTTTSRCRPRLSASVSPKRDRSLPYVFTTRGRLGLPSGVTKTLGCKGRVSVQVKNGKKTISTRRVRVRSSTCKFTSKVSFKDRKRLGSAKSLRFTVRFLGNSLLSPRKASVKTVRIG